MDKIENDGTPEDQFYFSALTAMKNYNEATDTMKKFMRNAAVVVEESRLACTVSLNLVKKNYFAYISTLEMVIMLYDKQGHKEAIDYLKKELGNMKAQKDMFEK
jgi:hypothetical protein